MGVFEILEVAADCAYTLISIVAVFYGLAIHRYMRRRVKVARKVGNGRLTLARGSAGFSLRLTLVSVLSVVIGSLVTIRDFQMLLAPEAGSSPYALALRAMFVLLILGVMDSLRVTKRTYIRSEIKTKPK